MASYPYQPLNLPHQTRILTVNPGKFADDLSCSISNLSIDSPEEPYEALSYCWSKGVDRDPGIDPEEEIPWAVYGRDESGNTVSESGKSKWKDLVDHPYQGEHYIRMGGKMPDAPLICDGVEMIVGGELFRALRRIRKEDKAVRIWVDAICINQQDVEERNEHVKIMGRVYAGASHTRVWLGESTQMDFHAIRTMFAISEVFEDLFVKRKVLDHNSTMQEVQWHFYNTGDTQRLDWGLLADMLDRAWFKRTWIVQEIANSRDISVYLGSIKFPWSVMAQIILSLSEFKLQTIISECKAFKAIGYMEHLRKERVDGSAASSSEPFLTMLEELRDFKATIPSDKIYGILGLTQYNDDLVVDYAQTPEKVFTDFAVTYLKSGSLDILAHCVDSSKQTTLILPSWVPDWSRPGWTEPFRIRGLKASAAGNTKPSIFINEGTGVLRISGKVVDVVAEVETERQIPTPNQRGLLSDVTDGTEDLQLPEMAKYGGSIFRSEEEDNTRGDDDDDVTTETKRPINDAEYRLKKTMEIIGEHAEKWYRSLVDVAFPDKKATPQLWENLWRTLMCNRTRDNECPSDECATGMDIYYKSILEPKKGLARILEERADHQIESHGLSPQEGVTHYIKEKTITETFVGAHTKWTYNRRFFRTESGRFGWAVEGTKPGDIVVILYGCDYPFVLRYNEQKMTTIIGDCYIHGLMDGEGLETNHGFEEAEFRIV
ncbi:ankyrin and het domain-containing protein [Colletotrichum incanum]|uniref:Ankyrin and het domain-containing protein n=1 Tax=Colletotrichum incanum TaxID=1573173 RepID=A0A162PPT4_COLIC|nr:ankyrin and het domain-containing protein [Colletotrichum incanum]OHW98822.1 ankyrin and het domain-containing protein [Colletotrichum incanum]